MDIVLICALLWLAVVRAAISSQTMVSFVLFVPCFNAMVKHAAFSNSYCCPFTTPIKFAHPFPSRMLLLGPTGFLTKFEDTATAALNCLSCASRGVWSAASSSQRTLASHPETSGQTRPISMLAPF